MVLKGKGFILRHVKISDAKSLLEIELDKENKRNMMSITENIEDMKSEIKQEISKCKNKKPESEKFIIESKGKLIGYVSLHELNQPHNKHTGKISYATHPNFRGKGFMTKAVKLVTRYAFREYKLKRITAVCRTFNKSSARVLEKAGYVLEGIHKKEACKNGKYLDNMHWAKIK